MFRRLTAGLANLCRCRRQRTARILIIGTNDSGKTSLLSRLVPGHADDLGGSLHLNFGTAEMGRWSLDLCEYSSGSLFTIVRLAHQLQDRDRPLWRAMSKGARGVIFVIDSHNRADMGTEATGELEWYFRDGSPQDSPAVLILANKQDIPGSATAQDVADELHLATFFHGRAWHVQPASVVTGEGLTEGLECLTRQL